MTLCWENFALIEHFSIYEAGFLHCIKISKLSITNLYLALFCLFHANKSKERLYILHTRERRTRNKGNPVRVFPERKKQWKKHIWTRKPVLAEKRRIWWKMDCPSNWGIANGKTVSGWHLILNHNKYIFIYYTQIDFFATFSPKYILLFLFKTSTNSNCILHLSTMAFTNLHIICTC